MKKRIAFIAMLLTIASSHIAFADSGVVTASSLNIRQKSSTSSSTIARIPRNTKITTLGKSSSFYKIIYKGRTGYVSSSYIKIVKAVITSTKKPVVSKISRTAASNKLVSYSYKLLGMPYKYGGTTPAKYNSAHRYISGGFDCSSLVQYVYKGSGIAIPRTTYGQVKIGKSVNMNNLQKGDLVFFIGASHVGMYVGNNKFIHARKTGTTIQITQLSGYWRSSFVTGRRILK